MSVSTATKSRELNYIDFKSFFVSAEDDKNVLFEENLRLVDEDGILLDKVTLAIEDNGVENGGFSVYVYTLGVNRQLRVESQVTRDLETPCELRRIRGHGRTTTLRITDTGTNWDVLKFFVDGSNGWKDLNKIPKSSIETMVLEGANILLMRKIATSTIFGFFSGWTLNHEGELCACVYEAEEGVSGEVVVQRTVRGPRGEADVLTTTLSAEGRVLEHHWSRSSRYLVGETPPAEPELDLQDMDEDLEMPVPQPEEMADQQAYYERKETLLSLYRLYQMDNTDVDDMIADFLKNLLIEKPDDAIEYADKYFSEFMDIKKNLIEKSDSDFINILNSTNSRNFE